MSICITRLGVEAHFLPKAAVPLLPTYPLLDPYLGIEWGPYPTDVLCSVRTAGNRLASAPAIISLDQSASSSPRRRRHCFVTSLGEHDRPLAAMLRSRRLAPFPRFSSLPHVIVILSSRLSLSRSDLCTSNVSTCFFAPRNRLPVGRMYRYAAAVRSIGAYVRPPALICFFGHDLELRDALHIHRR